MTANCPMLAAALGSRRTATRFKPGASALSRSSHFPLMLYSNAVNPVVLPPGRARLLTNPAPTGSTTIPNTIGTLLVTRCSAATAGLAEARMTSGASATNSPAYRGKSAASTAQRMSVRTLLPSVHPSLCISFTNAVTRAWPSGSSERTFMSTPIRRIRSACWARAARDHAAAVPPMSAMNCRRFMRSPLGRRVHPTTSLKERCVVRHSKIGPR